MCAENVDAIFMTVLSLAALGFMGWVIWSVTRR